MGSIFGSWHGSCRDAKTVPISPGMILAMQRLGHYSLRLGMVFAIAFDVPKKITMFKRVTLFGYSNKGRT